MNKKKMLQVVILIIIIAAAFALTVVRLVPKNEVVKPVQGKWEKMDPAERDRQLVERWKEMGMSQEQIEDGLKLYREKDKQREY